MMKTRLNDLEIPVEELRRQTRFAKLRVEAGRFAGCAEDVVRRCELEAQCGRDFCLTRFVPTARESAPGWLHAPQDKLPVVLGLIRLLMPGCTVVSEWKSSVEFRVTVSWDEEAKVEEGK